MPYRFLESRDTVVQVGSARDILAAGRSRAIHFTRFVPTGLVVVVEADPENCRALSRFLRRHDISNLRVVQSGAWEGPAELTFLSSSRHPAANVLSSVKAFDDTTRRTRDYHEHKVKADSLDNILASLDAPVPKLVSITTNGAEKQILAGMAKTIAAGCEYVSIASTMPSLVPDVTAMGYKFLGRDDRGYSFKVVATQ